MSLDPSEFEPFRCEVDPHRASVFVRPVGELDLATVPIVDAQLSELAGVSEQLTFASPNGSTRG